MIKYMSKVIKMAKKIFQKKLLIDSEFYKNVTATFNMKTIMIMPYTYALNINLIVN